MVVYILGFGLLYLTRLQSLRLDANKLSLIKSDEVLKLAQLKILDVSNCKLENLDVKLNENSFHFRIYVY